MYIVCYNYMCSGVPEVMQRLTPKGTQSFNF